MLAAAYSVLLPDSAVEGDTLYAQLDALGEIYIKVSAFDGVGDFSTSDHEKIRELRDLLNRALGE